MEIINKTTPLETNKNKEFDHLLDYLINLTKQISRRKYSKPKELFKLTNAGVYPERISELAESFGMMIVKVEARELRLEQSNDKLKKLNEQLRKEITNRKQIEEALREARDNLEAKVAERTEELTQANIQLKEFSRLKSLFLANMNHELKTPLNSIIGFTGILLMEMSGSLNEEQKKQLTIAKNSANHLLSLINDILEISRIEAGKAELYLEEFHLGEVIEDVIKSFSPIVNKRNLKITTEATESIKIISDKKRVKQVLMNFVSNAIKFTEQGSVKIKARILEDKILELCVLDTGIGIKKDDMDKLFQSFQQIDMSSTKKYEGVGLRLHLCKKLALLLGGDISVKSDYDKGSEFTFSLPLKYKKV